MAHRSGNDPWTKRPITTAELEALENAVDAAPAKGTANTDVEKIKALYLPVDTRNVTLGYTSGRLTSVQEKDGAAVVRTVSLGYTGDRLTTVTETAGGVTITTTLGYNGDGTLASVTKVVS